LRALRLGESIGSDTPRRYPIHGLGALVDSGTLWVPPKSWDGHNF